jgi:uncharacterized membrane protein
MTETTNHRPPHAESDNYLSGTGPMAGLILGAATLTTGLIAGFFFDWAVAIMPALARSDDQTFVNVMLTLITTINTSPAFLFAFVGAFVFTIAAAVVQYLLGARAAARWITAALAFYFVASAITFGVHFPLHEALASAGNSDTVENLAAVRKDFERPWVSAHLVRTVACTLAFTMLCRALWLRRR